MAALILSACAVLVAAATVIVTAATAVLVDKAVGSAVRTVPRVTILAKT